MLNATLHEKYSCAWERPHFNYSWKWLKENFSHYQHQSQVGPGSVAQKALRLVTSYRSKCVAHNFQFNFFSTQYVCCWIVHSNANIMLRPILFDFAHFTHCSYRLQSDLKLKISIVKTNLITSYVFRLQFASNVSILCVLENNAIGNKNHPQKINEFATALFLSVLAYCFCMCKEYCYLFMGNFFPFQLWCKRIAGVRFE